MPVTNPKRKTQEFHLTKKKKTKNRRNIKRENVNDPHKKVTDPRDLAPSTKLKVQRSKVTHLKFVREFLKKTHEIPTNLERRLC